MTTKTIKLKQEIKIKQAIKRAIARDSLLKFITYTKKDYDVQWFHELTCGYLDQLYRGEIKKLMIFIPPQHGKSEISSRRFPAYVLGKSPKTKIAVCSYSPDLATGFNRSIQDILDATEYKELFPKTQLLSAGIASADRGNTVRNSTQFETVKYKGFVKTVGIGSALTGTPVDIGIIDDPFKDRKTANSAIIRQDAWDWYNDVFKTRLHNNSKQLLLFTRWHEDDLAGRLLDRNNPNYDAEEAKEWTVIALPALKEKVNNEFNTVELNDTRKIDEALWESRHSAAKYIARKRTHPTSFASLDQQRPSLKGGNKIRKEWFNIIKYAELPYAPNSIPTHFYIDGAYTEKLENDETGLLACSMFRGNLYIYSCIGVRQEMHRLLNYFPDYFRNNHGDATSRVNIELKASGYSLLSMMKMPEYGNFNALGINNKVVALGKLNRVEAIESFLASGRVYLIQGSWNESFIDQCATFPNGLHDDMVDCLAYAVMEHFITSRQYEVKAEEVKNLNIF